LSEQTSQSQESSSPTTPAPSDENPANRLLSNFVSPFSVSASAIGKYSVGLIVLVNIYGVIVAGTHYTKAGVPLASLPLTVIWGAGITFGLITILFLYAGFAAGFGLTKRTIIATLLPIIIFALNTNNIILRASGWGVPIYLGAIFLAGLSMARLMRPEWLDTEITSLTELLRHFAWPILYSTCLAWFFATYAYPFIGPALGGGRAQPVLLTCNTDCSALLKDARVYQVYATAESLFFALEYPKGTQLADGAALDYPFEFEGGVRYLQLPRLNLKSVIYLPKQQAWHEAPSSTPAGASQSLNAPTDTMPATQSKTVDTATDAGTTTNASAPQPSAITEPSIPAGTTQSTHSNSNNPDAGSLEMDASTP